MPELIVEGRRFPADHPHIPMAFAQHLADDYERDVVVYERVPGAAKVRREVVKPTCWRKL